MAFVDEGAEVILRAGKVYRWQGLPNTTFTLELRDNDDVLVASLDRTGRIVSPSIPVVDTADQGFFWGVNINHPIVTTTSAAVLGSNDQVKVKQFVLPFRVVVGLITFDVTTLEAATNGGIGLYDAGGSLVVETGAIDVSSTGIQQITISPTSTVEPGVYFLAYTADGVTARFRGVNTGSNTDNLLNAGSVAKVGRAANSSSSGVLPATLGTITAENANPMALVLFGR